MHSYGEKVGAELRGRMASVHVVRGGSATAYPAALASWVLLLRGEVVLREAGQWCGEVKEGLPDWTEQQRTALSNELSDILIYLVRLAEKCHVDLPRAVLRKMELNRKRYPADRVRGSSKKYTEYAEEEDGVSPATGAGTLNGSPSAA
eukprot:g21274.t1